MRSLEVERCSTTSRSRSQIYACPQGTSELVGTGFGADSSGTAHAATGWLETSVPITAGETFTIRILVFDGDDGNQDSTALVDHFRWLTTPGVVLHTTQL